MALIRRSTIITYNNVTTTTNTVIDRATCKFYDSTYSIHYLRNPYNIDTISYNSQHLLMGCSGLHDAGFAYDNTLRLVQYFLNTATSSVFYQLQWNADNNLNTVIGTDTLHLAYYTDKPNLIGDYFEIRNFLTFGTPIMKTQNLTKSLTSPSTNTNITYTFDNSGRIVNTRSMEVDKYVWGDTSKIMHSYWLSYSTP